ncbi:MAG: ABC transporter substrate-binding protein [Anaerolineae bacterium]
MIGQRVSRRLLMQAMALSGLGLALASCGATPAPTSAPAATPAAEQAAATTAVTPAAAPAEKSKITYGTFAEGSQLEGFTKITDRFSELHPEYEVEVQAKPWGQHWEALEVQVAGGSPPDVSWITPNYAYHFFRTGHLVDVTDMIQKEQIDISDYVGEVMEAKFEGRYYGMPYGNGAIVWIYNKDMFDEAGLSHPNQDWTWADFRSAAKQLTKEENGQKTRWGLEIQSWWENYAAIPLGNGVCQFSGGVFTDNGGYFDTSEPVTCMVNDPKFVQAMTWVEECICKDGSNPRAGEITLAPGIESAFDGQVIGIDVAGSWEILAHRRVQFNWDLCLVPKSPHTGQRRTTSYALPHSIMKGSKNVDGAWAFIKWHAEQEAQEMLAVSGVKDPMLKTALDKLSGSPDHFREVLMDHYLNYNWNMSTMVFDGQPEAESEISTQLDYVWTCERTFADIAPEIEASVNAILKQKQTAG